MTCAEAELRNATPDDLESLLAIEQQAFESDRLSRRAMRSWLSKQHRVFLVAEREGLLVGYVLILHLPGTRLGRVYSLAVAPEARGAGLGATLLEAGEREAARDGCIDLRLEVARTNQAAIRLYREAGYLEFGVYENYYEDHADALRFSKRIRHAQADTQLQPLRWMRQSTPFTCGPAALMMALDHLCPAYEASLGEELRIWREATTVFMTSGHGGCHPLGLALAAQRRGVTAEVWIEGKRPLFVDGVRSELKKRVITQVDADYEQEAQARGLEVHASAIPVERLVRACDEGAVAIVLISTWRFDRKKAPHWVAVTGYDAHCLYLHDPDPGEEQRPIDCQHTPVARGELERMQRFGRDRLQAVMVLQRPQGR